MSSTPSDLINQRIADLDDWRGEMLGQIRALIKEADPDVVEEWKWMGTPVWEHNGIICTGESYKSVVKMTFAKGAFLPDPARLFNSSLEGNMRRAIDVREGETINAPALKALIRAAVDLNVSGVKAAAARTTTRTKATKAMKAMTKSKSKSKAKPKTKAASRARARTSRKAGAKKKPGAKAKSAKARKRGGARAKPRLLSGGNPQIAKGEGNAPVKAYIAAMPGWKRDVGKRLDALIERAVPGVHKAVKWNSPFYGVEGQGWFLGVHVFTNYVKVAFFRGASLKPIPPGESKHKDVRYVDIREGGLDEAQLASWVKQAAELPGWMSGKSA